MEIMQAIICVGMIMGLFVLAYGCVWVIQKIWEKKKDDIAI